MKRLLHLKYVTWVNLFWWNFTVDPKVTNEDKEARTEFIHHVFKYFDDTNNEKEDF